MDFRVLIVLFPILFSVGWTAFWLTKWGVFKWDVLGGLKNVTDG
tara:strand:+ start:964 stop:1095 length:132 start_codon:yes stop_codon:yes gene_type:complete